MRPHRLTRSYLEVDGVRLAAHLGVTVPPHGTAVVRLVAEDAAAGLSGRQGCSIFIAPPVERRELA
jgi:hypothetical protein